MIIGRYAVDPVDVVGGSWRYDPEGLVYVVTIERAAGLDLAQGVGKQDEAQKLLRLIDKAIEAGAPYRLDDGGCGGED